jgi:phosphatidate cytidylyltransferase
VSAAFAIRAGLLYGGLFALGAILLAWGHRRRGIPRADRRRMWGKYGAYLLFTTTLLASALAAPGLFRALVAVGLLICLGELLAVGGSSAGSGAERRPAVRGAVLGLVLGTVIVLAALLGGEREFEVVSLVALTAALVVPVFSPGVASAVAAGSRTVAALVFIPFLGSRVLLPGNDATQLGRELAFFYMVILVGDGMAQVGGRLWGSRRGLAVSPGKSLEGAAVGVASAVAAGYWLRSGSPVAGAWGALACALALSLAGQLGDLVASGFKRWAGVKDYGSWLPGFGGLLDRFDSLILAAPVLHLARLWGQG